jgi:hypothetical protein
LNEIMKFLLALPLLAPLLLLGSCSPQSVDGVLLAPVPYRMYVPAHLATRLSTSPVDGDSGAQMAKSGVLGATTVSYQSAGEAPTLLMSVYWSPAAVFDAGNNSPEAPPLGRAVTRAQGMVLSVAGPKDEVFPADNPDGQNLATLVGLIYLPDTYAPTRDRE